jgi:transitional endoplasmic reticulum ATPase
MDTSAVSEGSLVFSDEIMCQINTNILVPIKYAARCRNHGIPAKRGILLEGPYGTGKSLTAAMVAGVCEDNKVTFILLDRVQGLKAALQLAVRFGRSVVFAEDIDRIATERDERTNDLINTIDGVVSKSSEVMVILTSNHADKLNPVILRPGRLDAVISLKAPDAPTVKKLIRHYAKGLLEEDSTLDRPASELDGQIPASIRECVERAKLGMIGRNADKLSDSDLHIAALSMKAHLALLNRDQVKPSEADTLFEAIKAPLRQVYAEG